MDACMNCIWDAYSAKVLCLYNNTSQSLISDTLHIISSKTKRKQDIFKLCTSEE